MPVRSLSSSKTSPTVKTISSAVTISSASSISSTSDSSGSSSAMPSVSTVVSCMDVSTVTPSDVSAADTVTPALNNVEQPISNAIAPAKKRFLFIFTMLLLLFLFFRQKKAGSTQTCLSFHNRSHTQKLQSWTPYVVFMHGTGWGLSLIQCTFDKFLSLYAASCMEDHKNQLQYQQE